MNNMKQTQDDRTIQPFNCSTIQRVKAYAFTLAETLIVIGIIGVVAALTLPNLNHATGDKEKITKINKIHSTLVEAFDRAEAIYGPVDEWFNDNMSQVDNMTKFGDRITEFMKIKKNCGGGEDENGACWTNTTTKFFNGQDFANFNEWEDYYKFVDSSGLAYAIPGWPSNSELLFRIYVDIDGINKGPNTYAKDIFKYEVIKDANGLWQMVPAGAEIVGDENALKGQYGFAKEGTSFTQWIIMGGTMDYLKANSSGVCPNGTQLSWTQFSCN